MQQVSLNKMRQRSTFAENILIFFIMGFIYMGLEILWRGYTFFSMGFVGGLAGLSIGLINEKVDPTMPLIYQGFIGTTIILILEFISGIILNRWLELNIWDYSHLPYNIMGQICLYFSVLWFFLSIICVAVDDWLRVTFFGKEKMRYTWLKRMKVREEIK